MDFPAICPNKRNPQFPLLFFSRGPQKIPIISLEPCPKPCHLPLLPQVLPLQHLQLLQLFHVRLSLQIHPHPVNLPPGCQLSSLLPTLVLGDETGEGSGHEGLRGHEIVGPEVDQGADGDGEVVGAIAEAGDDSSVGVGKVA